jgi:hypothetical protein
MGRAIQVLNRARFIAADNATAEINICCFAASRRESQQLFAIRDTLRFNPPSLRGFSFLSGARLRQPQLELLQGHPETAAKLPVARHSIRNESERRSVC